MICLGVVEFAKHVFFKYLVQGFIVYMKLFEVPTFRSNSKYFGAISKLTTDPVILFGCEDGNSLDGNGWSVASLKRLQIHTTLGPCCLCFRRCLTFIQNHGKMKGF